ncbi:unnamed protein product [Protopolystoma xenopodis]|uniref:Uncharacterized protein n=1 Tax=Protopolystoma xenopodis TaxID=117903 RepID=A0A448X372_9PLAT|nr:unnamed protein product [Protopolystoma xenopodis]
MYTGSRNRSHSVGSFNEDNSTALFLAPHDCEFNDGAALSIPLRSVTRVSADASPIFPSRPPASTTFTGTANQTKANINSVFQAGLPSAPPPRISKQLLTLTTTSSASSTTNISESTLAAPCTSIASMSSVGTEEPLDIIPALIQTQNSQTTPF